MGVDLDGGQGIEGGDMIINKEQRQNKEGGRGDER